MPEVCEVALTAEILLKYLKNKILISLDFVSGRYARNIPTGFEDFNKALPLKVVDINSKGKFLWFDLVELHDKKSHWYIWNTLGLTGMWSFFQPKYDKAIMTFKGNRVVYFSDMRNFGTFKFSSDINELDAKIEELTPDFLKDSFDLSSITSYHEPVIKILMDQKKVGSGLGNYLAAEVLYRAKISPHRLGNKLSQKDINQLVYWIKYMTKLCYKNNHIGYMINLESEANKIPRHNYHPKIKLKEKEFEFQIYKQKTDPLGNKVKADKIINGRTTYWVPEIQK